MVMSNRENIELELLYHFKCLKYYSEKACESGTEEDINLPMQIFYAKTIFDHAARAKELYGMLGIPEDEHIKKMLKFSSESLEDLSELIRIIQEQDPVNPVKNLDFTGNMVLDGKNLILKRLRKNHAIS